MFIFRMKNNFLKTKIYYRRYLSLLLIGFFATFNLSCDLKSPTKFEVPTWFFDLTFPLVQQRYSLEGMVDNENGPIYSTPDSVGMQLMFEGTLPDTSISSDILEVTLNKDFSSDPSSAMNAPTLPSFSIDQPYYYPIDIVPTKKLKNSSGQFFDIPPSSNQTVTKEVWNQIASAFDTTIQVTINLPTLSSLPSFVKSVDGMQIKADAGSEVSNFKSTFTNVGLPTLVTNPTATLITDITSPVKTLANHTQASISKDANFGPTTTSLSGDSLGNAIRIDIGFGIAPTSNNTVTINAGDSLKVNVLIQLSISGLDSAIVTIAKTELPIDLDPIAFPSDVEIYGGMMKSPSGFDVNEIKINSLTSSLPLDIDFKMHFKNFLPPVGKDSTKLDTVLTKGISLSKIFNVDGYTFANPAGKDSALKELSLDISTVFPEQNTKLPVDGSSLGGVSMSGALKKLHFESLEANIIQEFPSTEFTIAGMPLGFSGMQFVNTKLEIEMLNGIRLPVVLDFDMIAVNQKNDTMTVKALSTLGSPASAADTAKTIVRLSNEGSTTLKYKAPSSISYFDSSTVPPKTGESTIVDLMSANPSVFTVKSRARIDGRGTLESGMSIGGKYRMLAPFEVIMEPMTFISVTNSPVPEMNHANRNNIRSTMQSAKMDFNVENKIPSGGDLSMLMSNIPFFPLDTTAAALTAYKDSLVIKKGWSSSDKVYIVSQCAKLNPETGNYYIFDVMDDFSDCIDGMSYIVKINDSGLDTIVSYVDTLLKIPLPEPVSFYQTTNGGVYAGQVKEGGVATYSSPLPTSRIRLMTNPGQPYMAPRFFLKGSNGKKVFMSTADYLDINSSVTFNLSSTGMTSPAPDEIVVKYPNGGQTINKDDSVIIKWKSYGDISKVNIDYFAGTKPDVNADNWTSIAKDEDNVDSLIWKPSATEGISSMGAEKDSIRIRISSINGKTRDMSGWYFKINLGSSEISNKKIINNLNIHGQVFK